MTSRFEGAITTPTQPAVPEAPARPGRPVSIELSAAILVIGGLAAAVGSGAIFLVSDASDSFSRPIVALILGLDLLTVLIGLLVRAGRAWVVCINVVAVLVFVELTAIPSGSLLAVLLTFLDGFVFVSLMRNRWWFDALRAESSSASRETA